MIVKGILLSLVHFLVFLGFYVFGMLPEHKNYMQLVSAICFIIFSVLGFRELFKVTEFSHFKTILYMTGTLVISTLLYNFFDYGFNTYYDTDFRYRAGRDMVEKINERRNRRGLPLEFFDKGKVDEKFHPQQYVYQSVNSSVANLVIVVLLLYPAGFFYRKISSG